MGRPLRIEYPGAFYHVTSRGNERRPIFHEDQDYERFLGYFESATERYQACIHSFCLIPNHYHLLLETPKANLHVILHHLNTSYTNFFNARRGRIGHLFQGRYRGILVERDSYALELSRYIHLNPVRAGLVSDPSDYLWSSYRAYLGKGKPFKWLHTDFIFGQLGAQRGEARRRYRQYVEEAIANADQNPLVKVVASSLLGSEKFLDWVREKLIGKSAFHRDIPALKRISLWPSLPLIQEETERVFGKGTKMTRKVGLYLAHRYSGLSLKEIADFFGGIGGSAVDQNTRRLEEKRRKDRDLSRKLDQLRAKFSE